MTQRALLTGSAGVIGSALRATLESRGVEVVGLDLRGDGEERGDVRDRAALERAARGCTGILHFAAVSRVAWGERDPEVCLATNVDGTRAVVEVALGLAERPWLVFASSREVYGEPESLPVTEDTPPAPVNVYGRSKAAGEALVKEARARGLRTAILRFSNVYGSPGDHADRVIPAFLRAALDGAGLRAFGAGNTFDFVHLNDTVAGVAEVVRRLAGGGAEGLPTVHLATGVGTSLGDLARLAVEAAGTTATIEAASPHDFHVSRFVGDPSRARAELGWSARIALREGLERLVGELRAGGGGGHSRRNVW